ncbi:MAG: FimV/HubP family polar landmark protein, partial [Vibrio sp.]
PEPELDDVELDFALDDESLPEFSEDDALAALDEQDDVPAADSAPVEPVVDPTPQADAPQGDEATAPQESASEATDQSDDELADSPLDAAESATDLDSSQPSAELDDSEEDFSVNLDEEYEEFTEQDALESAEGELEPEPLEDPVGFSEEELERELADGNFPEFTEEDALNQPDKAAVAPSTAEDMPADTAPADDESQAMSESEEETSESSAPSSTAQDLSFDEESLSNWLDDSPEHTDFRFDQPIDADTIDSAGMDLEAMLDVGGEDWNGFNLTPEQKSQISDDVPDDLADIWSNDSQPPVPEIENENWGEQETLEDVPSGADPSQFMTIDELMAQVENEENQANSSASLDEEELQLDVGLNEFPDVLGDISEVDVDLNAAAAGKLDLAKMYIEMNDSKGAIKLLEESIVDGDDDIRQEAKRLIDSLQGRS